MSETEQDAAPTELPPEETGEPSAEAGRDPVKAVTEFVREHPGLTVAGAIAAGLIVGALLPRGTGRKIGRRAVQLAEVASAAGIAFGRDALEKAESARSDLHDRGAAAAERLGSYGETAAGQAQRLIGSAEQAATKAGRNIADKATELKSKIRR